MEFTKDELQVISSALHQLLSMHISADYEVEELSERIDNFLDNNAED